jgi:hypothetical protein
MRLEWIINDDDITRVRGFLNEHADNWFVKNRIRCNLRPDKEPVSLEYFWEILVGCLLTTQQPSGPGRPVNRFIRMLPHPLPYRTCCGRDDLAAYALAVFKRFGGIRRTTNISSELASNMDYLKNGGWAETQERLERVRLIGTPAAERDAAEFLAREFKGLGPKQSRNLLQWTGLSRHEIPIDSRITRWLNGFGFPFKLSASALSDPNYYNLVSDGFQNLCEACRIKPCVLDAAIFASYDGDSWTEENVTNWALGTGEPPKATDGKS